MAAAKRADAAELRRLLGMEPTLARARDAGGRQALHHLASGEAGGGDAAARALECLAALRAHDADLDDVNPNTGLTPLHRAVMSGNVAFALALADAGADADATSARERRSPLELCRDEAFRAELRARACGFKAARAKASAPPPAASASASASAGEAATHAPARRFSADGGDRGGDKAATSAAALSSAAEGGGAATAFSGGAAPPPEVGWLGAAPPPPPSPHSPLPVSVAAPPTPAAGDADDAPPGKLRRTVVLPEAAAATALADAWWRVVAALPSGGAPLERSPPTLRLAYRGVPPVARAAVWRAASGAAAAQAALASYGVSYRSLVAAADETLPPDASEQIDKDIRRSGISFGAGGAAGAAAAQLRRVLRALAALDPLVGYCQSLNSVAAMALLVLGAEADAFWLALAMCRWLQPPGYYSGDLAAARADASLVAAALCRKHPALRARLGGEDAASAMLSAFILPWLMTAYVGTVSLELALRVWDATLIAGQETLLRVAFALLDSMAPAAAAARDEAAAAAVLAGASAASSSSLAAIDALMERARDMHWPPRDAEAPGAKQHLPAPLAGALAGLEARVEVAGGAAAVRAAAVAAGRKKAAAGARAARGAMASLRARLRRAGTDGATDSAEAGPASKGEGDDDEDAVEVIAPHQAPAPEVAAAAATAALAAAAAQHVPPACPMLTALRMHEPLRAGAPGAPGALPAYLFEAAALAGGAEAEEVAAESAASEGDDFGDAAAAQGLLGSAARAGALSALRAFVDATL